MKKFLLTTTAIIALATQIKLVRAADIDPVGNMDFPTTFLSFEGGVMFDASPSDVSFDEDDAKLGDLGSLQPGDWGGYGRVELGQRMSADWDYKVGVAAVFLSEDSVSGEDAEATQKTSLQILDAEIGFHPKDIGAIQPRLFAGIRGLHSISETHWAKDDHIKLGEFDDDVFAIGPRIGLDLVIPLDSTNLSLVGSASGSVLFGSVDSSYNYTNKGSDDLTRWNASQTIWNLEGMAGVSLDVGESADLTLGYRAAQFSGLMSDRSDIDKNGDFSEGGTSDLLVHGPFARLTVSIP